MSDEKPCRRRNAPEPSSTAARNRMRAARPRDTAAELALRSALDRLGLAYTTNESPLPDLRRRADIIFPTQRLAVFVDGCFWHGCPVHGTWPKQNAEFWREKIETNRRRDAETDRHLRSANWRVVRVWEHEDPDEAAARIAAVARQSPSEA
jgi:DNA mismatch endonuclease (patch repair protein)